jgi:hypothetical protein
MDEGSGSIITVAKLTDAEIALRMCCKGLLPRLEAITRVIELAGESNAENIVAQLPDSLLADVRQTVAEAPTTEAGWAGVFVIVGGTFRSSYDHEGEQLRWRARYRAGVEALRHLFGDKADAQT